MTRFARLASASALSNLADGVFQITLPLVALGITRDPAAFAAVSVVAGLPWLLFALPAGALADRLDRRRTMALVNLGRAAAIGGLAALVATDHEGLWALYLLAFALGIGETLFDTAAQSILPRVVEGDELPKANSRLYAIELTANQFVGPPVGGLVVAVSATAALAGSSIAYVLAAVVLATLVGDFRPVRTGPATSMRADVVEGVRYLAGHRVLAVLALSAGLSNLALTSMMAVLALYVVDPGPVGLSEAGFGLLITALAAGSLAASAFVAPLTRALGRVRSLLLASALFPMLSLTPALSSNVWPIATAAVVTGVAAVVWNVTTVTLRQRIVPDHLLGRVNAGYRLVGWGTMPIGAALGGVLGDSIGLRGVFWVSAALGACCVPLLRFGLDEAGIEAAEADADRVRAAAAPSPA